MHINKDNAQRLEQSTNFLIEYINKNMTTQPNYDQQVQKLRGALLLYKDVDGNKSEYNKMMKKVTGDKKRKSAPMDTIALTMDYVKNYR
jgi:hypothetical protein